jgi:AraC-like DNA-binding protein
LDYTIETCTIITFIEQRIKQKLDFSELEKTLNFSYRHIREIFRKKTNITLSHYITARKIANCALEIVSTPKSLTSIACEYGFDSYDTFTRAFRRETGIRPSEFKKSGFVCGRKHICMGVYAPFIFNPGSSKTVLPILPEEDNMNETLKTQDSCILYGVPKVYYGRNFNGDMQGTPFPMCLQAVLDYMGQNVHYSYIMAASGASFRLRWNTKGWDLGAVDIRNIYDDPYMPFELAFRAVGRKYKILRKDTSTREEFTSLVKSQIDEGRPVIALGVVGPPEASIITGYRNNGETVLGWSLFQNNMEFAKNTAFDESGYFICSNWWENTEAVMAIGEEIGAAMPIKELLEKAHYLLATEIINAGNGTYGPYYGGQKAYSAWADALNDDGNFPKNIQLSSLFERCMCFGDAAMMIGEGRSYASGYISWVGDQYPEVSKECRQCANEFKAAAGCVTKMQNLLGGFGGEEVLRKFGDKEYRTKIASLFKEAQLHEAKASELLEAVIAGIG